MSLTIVPEWVFSIIACIRNRILPKAPLMQFFCHGSLWAPLWQTSTEYVYMMRNKSSACDASGLSKSDPATSSPCRTGWVSAFGIDRLCGAFTFRPPACDLYSSCMMLHWCPVWRASHLDFDGPFGPCIKKYTCEPCGFSIWDIAWDFITSVIYRLRIYVLPVLKHHLYKCRHTRM